MTAATTPGSLVRSSADASDSVQDPGRPYTSLHIGESVKDCKAGNATAARVMGPTEHGPTTKEEGRAQCGPRGREAVALDRDANSAATAGQQARRSRWEARRVLRKVTRLERVRKCGRVPVDGAGVAVVVSEGGPGERIVGYRGLATCGSVWACPRCSAVIGARRAQEIRDGLAAWQEKGGAVVLLTLTMRHHQGQSLAPLWKGLSTAWRKLMSHRSWKQFKQAAGVVGVIRAVEVTHGEAGWHVHVHALVLLDPVKSVRWHDVGGTPEFEAHFAALASRQPVIRAWMKLLAGSGFDAVSEAQDMRPVAVDEAPDHVAGYLTKQTWDAADEIARWASKRARGLSRTPMQLLHDFISTGDADDLDRWHEWERGSHGRRQMTWSRGLKQALGIAITSDDEVAEQGTEDDQEVNDRSRGDQVLTILPGNLWSAVTAAGLECAVLEVVERALDPIPAIQWFLEDNLRGGPRVVPGLQPN